MFVHTVDCWIWRPGLKKVETKRCVFSSDLAMGAYNKRASASDNGSSSGEQKKPQMARNMYMHGKEICDFLDKNPTYCMGCGTDVGVHHGISFPSIHCTQSDPVYWFVRVCQRAACAQRIHKVLEKVTGVRLKMLTECYNPKCKKATTTDIPCKFCDAAVYCSSKCLEADSLRHTVTCVYFSFRTAWSEFEPQRKT